MTRVLTLLLGLIALDLLLARVVRRRSQILSQKSPRVAQAGWNELGNPFDAAATDGLPPDHRKLVEGREGFKRLIRTRSSGQGFRTHRDFASPTLNVVDGLRLTVATPPKTSNTVYVLGGSTVFNLHTSDDDTICSKLQRRLNETARGWAVKNFGLMGATTQDRVRHFRNAVISHNLLARGDCVFILAGVNDSTVLARLDRKSVSDLALQAIRRLVLYVQSRSITGALLRVLLDRALRQRLLKRFHTDLFTPLRDLRDELLPSGVHLLVILQPCAVDLRSPQTSEIQRLLGYDLFQTLLEGRRLINSNLAEEPWFCDARRVFDLTSEAVYVDWAHTNRAGNELLAAFLFREWRRLTDVA